MLHGPQLAGALAHLGLARAYALQGDITPALPIRIDPDIPILKQAKAEYAKLK